MEWTNYTSILVSNKDKSKDLYGFHLDPAKKSKIDKRRNRAKEAGKLTKQSKYFHCNSLH